jgi:ABC-type branched-subunit amino acid transport system substrate-binding protein
MIMQRCHHIPTRAVFAGVLAVVVATFGALQSSAQTASTPGVTDKAVTLGFINSQTGVAAPVVKNAHKACQARVGAENAKGGVNGRKINLEVIDDKSSGANLTAAQDLVENRKVFAVINQSPFGFLNYRYVRDAGVPYIGAGNEGAFFFDKGNENVISTLGDVGPLPGLTYDTFTKIMKLLGASKVAAVGYGASPSSSESARAVESYAARAQGLKPTYLNTNLDFGSTDVGPIALGVKNSGADALYLPLDSNTNFAIVQGLQQNGVKMKANILATGYSQDLLDQPIAKTITPNDVMFTGYRPVELGGAAVKQFQTNLKKYAGLTGVPDYGTYTGYIACDLAIVGLKNAGKDLTRQGFVDAIRKTNGGSYNGAGLLCQPVNLSYEKYGTLSPTSCAWYVNVKNGKFNVLDGGKPLTGKLVGDPQLIKQYGPNGTNGRNGGSTTAAPST